MSVSLAYKSELTVVQTFTTYVSSGDATATFNGLNDSGTLTGATSVPVTKHSIFQKALSAGSASIDLTALPGITPEESVSFSGLKVQALKFRNLVTNANKITITKGASNGYGTCASGDAWTVVLSPGQSIEMLLNEAAPDVSGSAKSIDLSGTLAQVLECQLIAG